MTTEAVLCDGDIHGGPRGHSYSKTPKLVLMGVVIQKEIVFTLAPHFSFWDGGLLSDLTSLTYLKKTFLSPVWLVLFPCDGMKDF